MIFVNVRSIDSIDRSNIYSNCGRRSLIITKKDDSFLRVFLYSYSLTKGLISIFRVREMIRFKLENENEQFKASFSFFL